MSHSLSPRLRELTLTLTATCNLRCPYCYVPPGRKDLMDDRVLDAAIDLFARHADPSSDHALSFFGGEPFLQPDKMARAIHRARTALDSERKVHFLTPTNGLLLGESELELCARSGLELAVSIDGVSRTTGRPYLDGRDSAPGLLTRLPDILALAPGLRILARMTVTPGNVQDLARNVAALARLGFRKIVYLPDVGVAWSDEAIGLWTREHERLATWLIGAHGAGIAVPDLPVWRGIESRLLLHKPKRACGAGERLAAVTPDGRLVPCYRFAFEPGDRYELGNVFGGFTREDNLARFARLDPEALRPEHGECSSCSARDGCTHMCPAQGMLALGDPLAVPDVVCRLMLAQVEAIRPYAAVHRVPRKRIARPRWASAVVAAAMATAASSASCGGNVETEQPGGVTPQDAAAESTDYDADGPGVCPAMADAADEDQYSPGVCPVMTDAADEDQYSPGVCPVMIDAADDQSGPGQCPSVIDASDDADMPGLCKGIDPDAGFDAGPGPGIC